MRIQQLKLTRYGKFTDKAFDFGNKTSEEPDFHLIYGENEAGKSTTLAAYLDLLYGFEARNSYNFIHSFDTMEVGGVLEFSNKTQEFKRRKKKDGLFNQFDQLLDNNSILAYLSGIDRLAYHDMFSLNDVTLVKGGEAILDSKADVGRMLFSASSGIADLNNRLNNIKIKPDGFHKKNSRSDYLSALKDKITSLDKQIKQIDLQANVYKANETNLQQATNAYDSAIKQLSEKTAKQNEIELLLHAFADYKKLLRLQGEISSLSEITDVAVLNFRDKIEHLNIASGVYKKNLEDLVSREISINEINLLIKESLGVLECEGEKNPERLILNKETVDGFTRLVEQWSGLEAQKDTANRELENVSRELDIKLNQQTKVEFKGEIQGLNALKETLKIIQSHNNIERMRTAEHEVSTMETRLAEQMLHLAPWAKSAQLLIGLAFPEQEILAAWKNQLAENEKMQILHKAQIENLSLKLQQFKTNALAITQTSGEISDAKAALARKERDEAWEKHRHQLDIQSASIFEALLREDDEISMRRLKSSNDIAILKGFERDIINMNAELTRENEAHNAIQQRQVALKAQITRRLTEIDASFSQFTLSQFEAWQIKCDKALEQRQSLLAAHEKLREAQHKQKHMVDDLTRALKKVSLHKFTDKDFDDLCEEAQSFCESGDKAIALHKEIEELQSQQQLRESNVKTATNLIEEWHDAWVNLCKNCWLGESETTPTIIKLKNALESLDSLKSQLNQRNSHLDRIDKMRAIQVGIQSKVIEITIALTNTIASDDVLTLTQHYSERLEEAKAKSVRKIELQKQIEEIEGDILSALNVSHIYEVEAHFKDFDALTKNSEKNALKIEIDDLDNEKQQLYKAKEDARHKFEAIGGDAEVAKLNEQRQTVLLEIEDGATRYLQQKCAYIAMEKALQIYREKHHSAMMKDASEAFTAITRGNYIKFKSLIEKEKETLFVVDKYGSSKTASNLSKGTRSQLYLALRVARYSDFTREYSPVPFIADDIMESFDDERAEETFKILAKMATKGQVIYLTHHKHLIDIAKNICPSVKIHGF